MQFGHCHSSSATGTVWAVVLPPQLSGTAAFIDRAGKYDHGEMQK
jgi:hypothetical protein